MSIHLNRSKIGRDRHMTEARKGKIIITGAAGLVGQNLIPRLTAKGFTEIVAR